MSETPNLDKLIAVSHESQPIGAFLDWLQNEHGLVLARYSEDDDQLWPAHVPIQELLAVYFDIDLRAVERERAQVLRRLRDHEADGG